MKQVIRMSQLVQMLGVSKSTIHRLRKAGQFVQPITLGPRSVGYYVQDINNWLNNRSNSSPKNFDDCHDKLSLPDKARNNRAGD
jgi:prophage regulatory protein